MSIAPSPAFEHSRLNELLQAASDELDIPATLYEQATLKYEEVGAWLAEDEQGIGRYAPEIYPQGSFRLGTAVRPIDPSCDYDIDLVCHLDIPKASIAQHELKEIVGRRLKQHDEFARVLSPSRRCWNLSFRKQFHMDVLPAIPNAERPPDGILLTDTELVNWQKSNPKLYSEWFYRVMNTRFREMREQLAKSLNVSVEDVPEWRVKTPLQRAIQLLKRHRDFMFQSDAENRPVSIVLTTLAARAYQDENTVLDAIINLAANMPRYIAYRNGKWWVENPVEPEENFADKWNEKDERRQAFLSWLTRVQQDVATAARHESLTEAVDLLKSRFGKQPIANAEASLAKRFGTVIPSIAASAFSLPSVTGDASHRRTPTWPTNLTYKASIVASVHYSRGGKRIAELARRRIGKKRWLKFKVETNAPYPFQIHWQVVNTGAEAQAANALRGDFYTSNDGNLVRWESTLYAGVHWVQAFIVRDGVCVAKSALKYVPVA